MPSLPRAFFLLVPVCLPALVACGPVPATVVVVAAPAGPYAEPVQLVARPEAPLRPAHLWRFDEEFGTRVWDAAGGEHGTIGPRVDQVQGCAGLAFALEGNARSV